MANIYNSLQSKARHIPLLTLGYPQNPEMAMFFTDLTELNANSVDFTTFKPKKVLQKIETNKNGDEVERQQDDIRMQPYTITAYSSATSMTVSLGDAARLKEGVILTFADTVDPTLTVSQRISAVNTGTGVITFDSPGLVNANLAAVPVGKKLTFLSFAKQERISDFFTTGRQELVDKSNYVQLFETEIDSQLFDENKDYFRFETNEDKTKSVFADRSRLALNSILRSFFEGTKKKSAGTSTTVRQAGGVNNFITGGNRFKINGATVADKRAQIRTRLQMAYQSGITNQNNGSDLYGSGKLICLCTTKFKSDVVDLYTQAISLQKPDIYSLKGIDVNIETYNVEGFKLNMIPSNLMDDIYQNASVAFLLPVDMIAMYMLPNDLIDDTGKRTKYYGSAKVYAKAMVSGDARQIGLATHFSWIFNGSDTPAYQMLAFV